MNRQFTVAIGAPLLPLLHGAKHNVLVAAIFVVGKVWQSLPQRYISKRRLCPHFHYVREQPQLNLDLASKHR